MPIAAPNRDALMHWIGQSAVVLMAAAGVLEAGRKRFDLFGMVIIALAAALGTFYLARVFPLPARLFLIPEAAGLALVTMTGTKAAIIWGAPWLVASVMGVMTGVVGGILRDVLGRAVPHPRYTRIDRRWSTRLTARPGPGSGRRRASGPRPWPPGPRGGG
jgi:uncharacterized membrane protein YeiH